MSEKIFEDLVNKIVNLENSDSIKKLVKKALSEGVPASDIMEKGLRKGLEKVGEKYRACEYFLSELLFAAEIMNETMEILKSDLEKQAKEEKGRIVLGTVRGDIHDIGKNVFKMIALPAGFEVFDLGVDIEPEKFVEKIKETKSQILAISALLTTVLPELKNVIDALDKAGIRKNVKVIIGGNAVTKELAKEIKADGAALDAVEGVNMCQEWVAK